MRPGTMPCGHSRKKLAVFVPGHFLATGVQEGVAAGAYSNVACISVKGAQWWWQLMQHDLAQALDVQKRILQFFDECIVPYRSWILEPARSINSWQP